MTLYGSDTNCVTDVPLIDTQVTSAALVVGQRLARILQTPRGALGVIGDDHDRGWDVRQYVNARLSPSTIATAQQQITNECLKDEQVQSVDVTMTESNGTLTIGIVFVVADAPYSMTLNVSQLTVGAVFNF